MKAPDARAVKAGVYKEINGVWHKRCNGPAHDEATYMPATKKFFYVVAAKQNRSGYRFSSQCRLCTLWARVKSPGLDHGWIEANRVREYYIEGCNRVGMTEFARRVGMSAEGMSNVIRGKGKSVQKAKLRRVMLEIVSIRRNNEHSISSQAAMRITKRATGNGPVCAGCRVPMHRFTDDCGTCWDRKREVERRSDPEYRARQTKQWRDSRREKRKQKQLEIQQQEQRKQKQIQREKKQRERKRQQKLTAA